MPIVHASVQGFFGQQQGIGGHNLVRVRQPSPAHVCFIDDDVVGSDELVRELPQHCRVVRIDAHAPPAHQVLAGLQGSEGLRSLRFIAHGAPGQMHLGGQTWSTTAVAEQALLWQVVGAHLAQDGEILLCGCEVGAGEPGRRFVELLGELTGAQVYAASLPLGLFQWAELDVSSGNSSSRRLDLRTYGHRLALEVGTSGDDMLFGTPDDDQLEGLEGNDTLQSGEGRDTLLGGAGQDQIYQSFSSEALLDGGDGDDQVEAVYVTQATLVGGEGADTLSVNLDSYASAYSDGQHQLPESAELFGGAGNDQLTLSGWNHAAYGRSTATLDGGEGDDSLSVSAYGGSDVWYGLTAATLEGGAGNDQLSAGGVVQLTMAGGAGADTFVLSAYEVQTLLAGGRTYTTYDPLSDSTVSEFVPANPVLISDFSAADGDVLDLRELLSLASWVESASSPFGAEGPLAFTQQGSDLAVSWQGTVVALLQNVDLTDVGANNLLPPYPADGSDPQGVEIVGTDGDDILAGSIGPDTLAGAAGSDRIDGNGYGDSLTGDSGNDTLSGQGGDDLLQGGDDDDALYGGAGNDTMQGDAGNDVLRDNEGSNRFDGGDGDDNIAVEGWNSGSQTLLGGAGNDSLTGHYSSRVSIEAGDGDDSVSTHLSSQVTVQGGEGQDTVNVYLDNYYSQNTDGNLALTEYASVDGGDGNDNLTLAASVYSGYGRAEAALLGGTGEDSLSVVGNSGEWSGSYGLTQASLDGGTGADTLTASGVVQLTLTGGEGADRFVLTASQYRTLLQGTRNVLNEDGSGYAEVPATPTDITDFQPGVGGDVLDVSELLNLVGFEHTGVNPFAEGGPLQWNQVDADLQLSFDGTVVAVLRSVDLADLQAGNLAPGYAPDGSAPPSAEQTGSTDADTLTGSLGTDTIDGADGSDSITGGGSGDVLLGGAGRDTLYGEDGDDVLLGGDDADHLEGGRGNDLLQGEAGDDTLYSGIGNDTLIGGLDNDVLLANDGMGNKVLLGEEGSDQLEATGGVLLLDAGDGDNNLYGHSFGAATLAAGSGNDTLSANSGSTALLTSGAGHDNLSSHYVGSSTLVGGAGDDSVYSYNAWQMGAEVTVSGGDGNDSATVIYASRAVIVGDAGDDNLLGQYVGDLTLSGGAGDDHLEAHLSSYQSQVTDGISSRAEQAVLDGGNGNDSLTVSASNYVWEGQESVTLIGGTGNDSLSVVEGNGATNAAYGMASALLDGGEGDDTLTANGVVQLTLIGGAGADTFVLTAGQVRTLQQGDRTYLDETGYTKVAAGPAEILDFHAGAGGDVLDLSDVLSGLVAGYDGSDPFAAGWIRVGQVDADVRISLDVDGTGAGQPVVIAVLRNAAGADLVAGNFAPAFDVQPFLDAARHTPTSSDHSVTIDEDAAHVFSLADFSFADADSTDSLQAVKIDTLPVAGSLTLAGEAVLAGQSISAADIESGLLVYTPEVNAHGVAYAAFDFRVSDGDLLAATASTFGIDVTSVNDPAAGDLVINGRLQEGFTLTLSPSLMDMDGLPEQISYQWLADGMPIEGEVGLTLTLNAGLVGKAISVQATFVDLGGREEVLTSAATAPISDASTTPAGAVRMEGTEEADLLLGSEEGDVAEDMFGLAGNDTLLGQRGDDSLVGGEGDDSIDGGIGSDTLRGGAGNDMLRDEFGANLIDAADGNDQVVVGGSYDGDHTVSGGSGDDALYAQYTRTALVEGGVGNDTLSSVYSRSVTLDGGEGSDNLSANLVGWVSQHTDHRDSAVAETVSLVGGTGDDSLQVQGGDTYISYGQSSAVLDGGEGNDNLHLEDSNAGSYWWGNNYGIAHATLSGGEGDDTLRAGGAIDLQLSGGGGSDRFYLTARQFHTQQEGARTYWNADGSSTTLNVEPTLITDFQAGAGGDVLDVQELLNMTGYAAEGSNPFGAGRYLTLRQEGEDVVLSFDADATGSGAGTDLARLAGVTLADLINTNFSPAFHPDGSNAGEVWEDTDGVNQHTGTLADDTLMGLDGNDSLDGAAGSDSIDGGEGHDQLFGGSAGDLLQGNEGNDGLYGQAGDDTLQGGAGDDYLDDSEGSNQFDGGAGNDNLVSSGWHWYSAKQQTLSGGTGQDTLRAEYNIRAQLEGGEDADTLSVYANQHVTLSGGDGNDTVNVGMDGTSSGYFGAAGDHAESESAQIDGGAGDDVVAVYGHSTYVGHGQSQVAVTGGAGDDTVSVIDGNAGAYAWNSSAHGFTQAVLDGGDGADNLRAGGVLSLQMTGGEGADTFVITAQQYRTVLEGARSYSNADGSTTVVDAGVTVITDFQAGAGGDVLDVADLLTLTAFAAEGTNPFGEGRYLTLRQEDGDVVLSFDADAAGSGVATDIVRLEGVSLADLTKANFHPSYHPNGSNAGEVWEDLDGVHQHTGTVSDDTLIGLDGNDTLDGAAGSDSIDGGAGDDLLFGGSAQDLLQGGDDNDQLYGQAGNDTLQGGAGNDTLRDNEGSNLFDGGDGDDSIAVEGWNGGSHTLLGGTGNDSLAGNYSSRVSLEGGEGNDNLSSHLSTNATLQGGAGDDVVSTHIDNYYSAYTEGSPAKAEHALLEGGDGNDSLNVTGYVYTGYGQASATLLGGAGDDTLTLTGHWSASNPNYGFAQASLDGGSGNDTLTVSGAVQSSLSGGEGSDRFVFTAEQYYTLVAGTRHYVDESGGGTTAVDATPVEITDFQAGANGDVLDLSALLAMTSFVPDGSSPFAPGSVMTLTQVGEDLELAFDPDGGAGAGSATVVAVLRNVQLADLAPTNFSPVCMADGSEIPGTYWEDSEGVNSHTGSTGTDTLIGLDGDDTLSGGLSRDLLDGGDGQDILNGDAGADTLLGGAGNDTLTDGEGANLLDGGEGDDTLANGFVNAAQTLLGGVGNDLIETRASLVVAQGGSGNDSLFADGTRWGWSSTDTYYQHHNSSVQFSGGEGQDSLRVHHHDQATLSGGDGQDSLTTYANRSATLDGGSGADVLFAEIEGWASGHMTGNYEQEESVLLDGGADDDQVSVRGRDTSSGYGQSSATLRGGEGADTVSVTDEYAGQGHIYGGWTQMRGIAHATLEGGAGADRLVAGGVVDLLMDGGEDADVDTFVLTAQQYRTLVEGARYYYNGDGSTTTLEVQPTEILHFTPGDDGDVLDVSELLALTDFSDDGSNPFAEGRYLKMTQVGDDLELSFDPDEADGPGVPVVVAVLRNVQLGDLVDSNIQPPYMPDGSDMTGVDWTGTPDADAYTGTLGNDTLNGSEGSDTLDGNAGRDTLLGGEGDDSLLGGLSHDSLDGGLGNDTLNGGSGSDTLLGGDGDDRLEERAGANLLEGGAGQDHLYAFTNGTQVQTLHGGDGDDTIESAAQGMVVDGGSGNDSVTLRGYAWWEGVQQFNGSAQVSAGEGNDSVAVYDLKTVNVEGGAGDDSLSASASRDVALSGGVGADSLGVVLHGWASAASDSNNGIGETALLDGGADSDSLTAQASDSWVGYGQMRVTVQGGEGDDTLSAADSHAGHGWSDHGIAHATLDGGDGADILSAGGVINLQMTGGTGADTFVITAQQYRTVLEGARTYTNADGSTTQLLAGPAVITDFQAGEGGDVLNVSDLLAQTSFASDGSNPFAEGRYLKMTQVGADLELSFDPDEAAGASAPVVVAVLRNVQLGDLVAGNINPPYRVDGSDVVGEHWVGTEDVDAHTGTLGNDTLSGLAGNDTLDGGAGRDVVDGGDGDDALFGGVSYDSLDGGQGNDTLDGGAGADTLFGGAGNDIMRDNEGSNLLDGGEGDDNIEVENWSGGQQTLLGGAGTDTLRSVISDQVTLDGGDGSDSITTYLTRVVNVGAGGGNDAVSIHLDNGYWYGSSANVVVDGGEGNDDLVVSGYLLDVRGRGDASIAGAAGDDHLSITGYWAEYDPSAGFASATLDGGSGNDILEARGVVELTLTGGDGADRFVLTNAQFQTAQTGTRTYPASSASVASTVSAGPTVITDFQAGEGGDVLDVADLLALTGYTSASANPFGAAGHLALVQSGTDVVVRFDADGAAGAGVAVDVAVLRNVQADQLVNTNFTPERPLDGSENTAPTSADATLATLEDQPLVLGAADFVFADVDSGDSLQSVTLVALPESGTLTLHGLAVEAGTVVNLADLQAGALVYTPHADANGLALSSLLFTVSDGEASSAAQTLTFDVGAVNDAPSGRDQALAIIDEGEAITFTVDQLLETWSDPEGDPLSVADLRAEVIGSAGDAGALVHNEDGTWTLTPPADFNGHIALTYAVSDGQGGERAARSVLSVTAVNDAPQHNGEPVALAAVAETDVLIFTQADLLAGWSDVDGDALTLENLVFSPAERGSLVDNGDGSWTFTPTLGQSGPLDFAFEVVDGQGARVSAQATGQIDAVDNTPVLNGSPFSLPEGVEDQAGYTVRAVDLLTGWSNAYGEALQVADLRADHGSFAPTAEGDWVYQPEADYHGPVQVSYTVHNGAGSQAAAGLELLLQPQDDAPRVTAAVAELPAIEEDHSVVLSATDLLQGWTDADGQPLQVVGLSANDGLLEDLGDGSWRFTPTADFHGSVQLHYGVSDGVLTTPALLSFDVTPTNDAPTAAAVDISATEDEVATGNLPQATDVDGDAVTYTLVEGPANGQVTVGTGGSYVYTPNTHFNGSDSFSYQVSDGRGGVSTYAANISVAAVNDAPTGAPTAELPAGTEDQPYTIAAADLLAGFSDLDGDTLSVVDLTADHGSITANDDGSFTLTPEPDYFGPVQLSYTVQDTSGAGVPASIGLMLEQANRAPVLGDLEPLPEIAEDGSLDITAAMLLQGITDANGDVLTLADLSADVGSVTQQPDGSWHYSPPQDFNGEVGFSYTVSDGIAAPVPVTRSLLVTAVNDAAEITGDTSGIATETDAAVTLTGRLAAVDVDNDAGFRSETLTGAIGSLSIDTDGAWTFTAADAFDEMNTADSRSEDFTVRSVDGTEQTVSIRIDGSNDAATFDGDTSGSTSETNAAVTLTGRLTATDVDNATGFRAETVTGEIGSLSIDADGAWTFTAAAAFDEMNTLDFRSEDFAVHSVDGSEQTISIRIDGTDDAAEITGDTSGIATETDAAVTLTGRLTAVDVDNDAGFRSETLTGAIGSLSIDTDGAWTFTAAEAFDEMNTADSRSEDFTVRSVDGTEQTVSIRIDGSNDAPTLQVANDDQEAAEGRAFSVTLPEGLFADVDSSTLTLTATLADGSALPTWLSFDAATRSFSGTPAASDAGVPSRVLDITVTATDGGGLNARDSFALTIYGKRTVTGTAGADLLLGNLADETFNALGGNDTLRAAGGDDTLNGGSGADLMEGGAGNDSYSVDNNLDQVVEAEGLGDDTVNASISHTLADHVENLVLTGSSGLAGTGNALANRLTGNGGANTLDGGAGADTLAAGLGNDTYIVDDEGDVVIEEAGTGSGTDIVKAAISWTLGANLETLTLTGSADIDGTGNELANILNGNAGHNRLDGGAGSDRLTGGAGNDTYVLDSRTDTVVEALDGGIDGVEYSGIDAYTLANNVENLRLTGAATAGTGNALDNLVTGNERANTLSGAAGNDTLEGGEGNDSLNGGSGADSMAGGAGDDSYTIDHAGDVITELDGQGSDSVSSSVSWTLSDHVENLTLTGGLALNATGNALGNQLKGNSGANRLDGGAGADTLVGGSGNDTYIVDDAGDQVTELASQGTDLVQAGVSWTLGDQIENLTLTGAEDLAGTGNALANRIVGNAGANWLGGGLGNDSLTGGVGADTFVFDTAPNSSSNLDTLTDFSVADDTLALAMGIFGGLGEAVEAGELRAGAGYTTAVDANDHLIYDSATGLLRYDADGAGGVAAVQLAKIGAGLALTAADFVVTP